MNALSQDVIVQDMYKELNKKLKITLQPIVPFEMPVVWYEDLLNCIKNERPYVKLCWLRQLVELGVLLLGCQLIRIGPFFLAVKVSAMKCAITSSVLFFGNLPLKLSVRVIRLSAS